MNEQQLMRVSFLGSVAGIVAIYIVVLNISIPATSIGEITGAFVGSDVNVTGDVSDVYRHANGHIFFTLDDGSGHIKVVLWDDVVSEMERRGRDASLIKDGTFLNVVGEVTMYRGELEVIPRSPELEIIPG